MVKGEEGDMILEAAMGGIAVLLQTRYKDKSTLAHKSLSLGFEALKRVLANRQPIRAHWNELLPGETKEKGKQLK